MAVVIHQVKVNGTVMKVVKESDYQELKNNFDSLKDELNRVSHLHYEAQNRSGENSILAESRLAEIKEKNGILKRIQEMVEDVSC